MNLYARIRAALEAIPPGSLIPADWVRGIIDECGASGEADLTVEEFGAHLTRAPSTIRTWCAQGKIPGAYRLHGREWRIPRAALRALQGEHGSSQPEDGPVDLSSYRKRLRAGG